MDALKKKLDGHSYMRPLPCLLRYSFEVQSDMGSLQFGYTSSPSLSLSCDCFIFCCTESHLHALICTHLSRYSATTPPLRSGCPIAFPATLLCHTRSQLPKVLSTVCSIDHVDLRSQGRRWDGGYWVFLLRRAAPLILYLGITSFGFFFLPRVTHPRS